MLHQMRRTIRRASRWFLRHRNKSASITESIELYKPTFDKMSTHLGDYLVEKEKGLLLNLQKDFEREGVPTDIAAYVAQLSSIFSIMDIADVSHATKREVEDVAKLYFTLGSDMGLHWFLDQITNQPVSNHWQALARASYREELDWQQRALTGAVIHFEPDNGDILEVYAKWKEEFGPILGRWQHMISEFKSSESHEFAKFSVALRELMLLSHHCETSV